LIRLTSRLTGDETAPVRGRGKSPHPAMEKKDMPLIIEADTPAETVAEIIKYLDTMKSHAVNSAAMQNTARKTAERETIGRTLADLIETFTSATIRSREETPYVPTENPPRNRQPIELPILDIQIEGRHGIKLFNPNSLVMAYLGDKHRGWEPLGGIQSELFDGPLNKNPAKGAFWYRAGDLALRLSAAELERLVMLNLKPAEYWVLLCRYGMAHEWHEDFYDPRTGIALQPRPLS
jgi:hypothetical protein